MTFTHKLRKLADPAASRSARRHAGRFFFRRRFSAAPVQAICQSIDPQKFQEIHDRYTVEDPGEDYPKYLDLEKWMSLNLAHVYYLDLDWGTEKRVLDLGAGAGYFPYICKWFGHEPTALDLPTPAMFGEMTALLGVPRVVWRIEPYESLPASLHGFDLITAFRVCFNGHNSKSLWGAREWTFFLDDLESRLNPGGRIHFGFNRERDGEPFPADVRSLFLERGARIEHGQVTYRPE